MMFNEYYKYFPEEEICIQILKNIREQEGVICKKCGNEDHYWKNDKKTFECKQCNYRTSLKKGTVIENSKLPIRYWLAAISYLNITGKKVSALELQKEFCHKRYEPIWLMLKKIRNISKADPLIYKISDYIVLDKNLIDLK
ncbi:MAG: IS1595 family transposase [Bacteroidota bacterium]|nr:IS1595 family transposase [Bacteroidota bacterium]